MADSSITYQLVSITDAARILALSESTVRQLVKAGRLEAEQVQRPQGHVWLVKVPAPSTDQVEQPPDQPPAVTQAEALTGLVQATVATVLGPLVAELAASRQTNERQAERLEAQAETIGSLRTENATLRAAQTPVAAQPAPAPAPTPFRGEPPATVWRRLWPLALVAASMIMLVLLVSWLW